MTAPEARTGGPESNARGLMVLAAALVVGFLLLANWGNDSSSKTSATDNSSAPVTTGDLSVSTTAPKSTTTTSGSDHAPSEVSVIVLNGSGQSGAAATNSTTIGDAGYTMQTPGNAPATTTTTTVYYKDGYQADAIAVAGLLGRSTDVVKPLSDASLGGAEGDADVVVVLGSDIPPVSATTTTTA